MGAQLALTDLQDSMHMKGSSLDLIPRPESVRAARAFVAEMLDLWDCDDPEHVVSLLTSEIVTNAVRCAVREIGLEATLTEQLGAGEALLTVATTDDRLVQPILLPPSTERGHGRGLQLVQALAYRWGVQALERGKSVWFQAFVPRRAGTAELGRLLRRLAAERSNPQSPSGGLS